MDRVDYELSKADKYDYVVVNDDLDEAVKKIFDIIKSEKDKK
jgi:guanylate kinase